jgi:hypothetical protein
MYLGIGADTLSTEKDSFDDFNSFHQDHKY